MTNIIRNSDLKKDVRIEYSFLTNRLDRVMQALDGCCDDIDCNKFGERNCLKTKYKPLVDHEHGCLPVLKLEHKALMRILSLKRYHKCRFRKCTICEKEVDTLDDKTSEIIILTKPNNEGNYNSKLIICHKKCAKKVKVPNGWSHLFD